MDFTINQKPPTSEEILAEQQRLNNETRRIKTRDTLITFSLILLTSAIVALAVYWSTSSIKYAAIAFSIFPVLGTVMGIAGLITVVGFRSNAMRVIELKNELVALLPVDSGNEDSIRELCRKYPQVENYRRQVEGMGRAMVNGELAMFWGWDASTGAKQAKQRAYFNDSDKDTSTGISAA